MNGNQVPESIRPDTPGIFSTDSESVTIRILFQETQITDVSLPEYDNVGDYSLTVILPEEEQEENKGTVRIFYNRTCSEIWIKMSHRFK